MPAVLAGIAGAVAAKLAEKDDYGDKSGKLITYSNSTEKCSNLFCLVSHLSHSVFKKKKKKRKPEDILFKRINQENDCFINSYLS